MEYRIGQLCRISDDEIPFKQFKIPKHRIGKVVSAYKRGELTGYYCLLEFDDRVYWCEKGCKDRFDYAKTKGRRNHCIWIAVTSLQEVELKDYIKLTLSKGKI